MLDAHDPQAQPPPRSDRRAYSPALAAGTGRVARASRGAPVLLLAVAVAATGAAVGTAAGQSPAAVAAWLCLPVAAAASYGVRGVVVAAPLACAAALASGGGVQVLALPCALLVATGLLVAALVRSAREADRALLATLERERAEAVQAASQRDALSRRLEHQALHDALTGLPNRIAFLERLRGALRASAEQGLVGVLFLDLDDFKTVNDRLGHAAGDELLAGVGRRLQTALRSDDLVARFGGDEFAVLLVGGSSLEQVLGVANRLLGVLRAPFALAAGMASGQGSGGLALASRTHERALGEQVDDLMRQADLAMYAAKAAGDGRCVEYRDELQAAVLERLELQDEVTSALIHEAFSVVYQPVVDVRTGRLLAVEALVRWYHPDRGEIPPSTFIPVAERSGAIVPLGLWVLEQACLDLQLWDQLCPGNDLRVSVNLSARQLAESGIGPQIARVLHRLGVDPRRLALEVTESLLMGDREAATATLWQLRALGIRIAVDDFGTGFSSLSRLVDLPLDDLKIDRTFVAELERSEAGATIIHAAIAMGHGLGLTVVAEGVETVEQLEFLAAAGCDAAQGYLISRPVAEDAIVGMLKRGPLLARGVPLPAPRPAGGSPRPGRPTATVIPPRPRHR